MKWLAVFILLSLSRAAHTQTIEYVHTDPLGSPVAITNQAGQVIERMQYEPFGAALNGDNRDRPGYTGHVMDSLTLLTYMQQRYYDPHIAAFLSVDPVAAYGNSETAFNRYWYANNNPYSFRDPDGREAACMYGASMCGLREVSPEVKARQRGMVEGTAAVAGILVTELVTTKGFALAGRGISVFRAWRAERAAKRAGDAVSMVNPKILISRQGRDEISGSQVKRLARNMREEGYDVSKPVEIANVEGKRIIIDGHHRVEAAKRAGISEIPARTLPTTSNQDSQLLREAAEASKFRTER